MKWKGMEWNGRVWNRMNEWINEWINEFRKEWLVEYMKACTSEPTLQWVNVWLHREVVEWSLSVVWDNYFTSLAAFCSELPQSLSLSVSQLFLLWANSVVASATQFFPSHSQCNAFSILQLQSRQRDSGAVLISYLAAAPTLCLTVSSCSLP